MVCDGAQPVGKVLYPGYFIEILFGNGGIDLEFNSCGFCRFNTAQCAFIRTLNPPECIVCFRRCAVKADADPFDTGSCQLLGNRSGNQGAVRRHYHAQPLVGAVARDLANIRSQKGFSTGKDHDRISHRRDFIQNAQTGLCVQFTVVWPPGCSGPAMDTRQVTVTGDFPGDKAQGTG